MAIWEKLSNFKELIAEKAKQYLRHALNPIKEHIPSFIIRIAFDSENHDLNIAMIKAVKERKFVSAAKLIQRGANPNIQSSIGNTLLINAAFNSDIDCCKFLISHGADIKVKNNDGFSALDIAEILANERLQLLLLVSANSITYKTKESIFRYWWKIITLLIVIKFASIIFFDVIDNNHVRTYHPKVFTRQSFE